MASRVLLVKKLLQLVQAQTIVLETESVSTACASASQDFEDTTALMDATPRHPDSSDVFAINGVVCA